MNELRMADDKDFNELIDIIAVELNKEIDKFKLFHDMDFKLGKMNLEFLDEKSGIVLTSELTVEGWESLNKEGVIKVKIIDQESIDEK